MLLGSIKVGGGFVQFVFAIGSRHAGALRDVRDLGLRERLECTDRFESLVEDVLTVDTRDLHGDGKIEAELQRFNRCNCFAVENNRRRPSCRVARSLRD
jgi:hypothetical protein